MIAFVSQIEIGVQALAAESDGHSKIKSQYMDVLEACRIKAGDVQAEPYLAEGEIQGFRYTLVRPGSAYARAGFKVGDILIEQNGLKLRSPDDIVRAFESVSAGEPQISNVRRGDKTIAFKMICTKKLAPKK